MITGYLIHTVNFFLENGANPDTKTSCGSTALHFAATNGHLLVVEDLLKYGAHSFVNNDGMTPIKAAADRGRIDIVEYLISIRHVDTFEQIEALELLGAFCACDEEGGLEAFKYFHRSMTLRFADPEKPIKKVLITPIDTYENWVESQTLSELSSIQTNVNKLRLEALTIRERILGSYNPRIPNYVIFVGALYANLSRYDRAVHFWLYALELKRVNRLCLINELQWFVEMFSEILYKKAALNYEHVSRVLFIVISELKEYEKKLKQPGPKADNNIISNIVNRNMKTTACLITIMTQISEQFTDTGRFDFIEMLSTLGKMRLAKRDGKTLLHMACHTKTPLGFRRTKAVCKYPNADTALVLIGCGASVDAIDANGNTPLHLLMHQNSIFDLLGLHLTVTHLLEAGAHHDYRNKKRKTPLRYARTETARIIMKRNKVINLQCLAAKAVKKYKLSYKGELPRLLEKFVDRH